MDREYTLLFPDILHHRDMEGVLVLDNQGNVLSANRAAESLLGYGVGQLTNIHVSELWAGRFALPRASREQATTERTRPEPARVREEELTRRNGEVLPVALTVAPLGANDDGQLLSFVSRAELDRLNEALPLPQLRLPFLFDADLGAEQVEELATVLLAEIEALLALGG